MPDHPLILAFDTSAAHCAAALLSGDTVLAEAQEAMAKGQAERLMGLVAEVLEAGGATPADLAAIGVGTGPGNFTGIRLSVSAARGLALALGIPAIGVSALEAQVHGITGPVLSLRDARRGEIYLQRFGTDPRGPEIADPATLTDDWARPGLQVVGEGAEAIAQLLRAEPCEPRARLAVGIARIAAARLGAGTQIPRPAPLYLRAADAAPARDAPPAIVP